MAGLFRATRASKPAPAATSLRVQTSVQGRALPIGCGQFRIAGNVINIAGFASQQTAQGGHGSKGGIAGGGGKGSTTQTTYSVSFVLSIGNIQVATWLTLFNGNAVNFYQNPSQAVSDALKQLGITNWTVGNQYGQSFYNGTDLQGIDPYWLANFAATAFAYHGESYTIFPQLHLGSSPSIPNFTVEVLSSIGNDIPALGPDANPADWITALLTNSQWGLPGLSSSLITTFDQYRAYCRATGMLISGAIADQTALNGYLANLMQATNSDFRWSSGVLDIVPYGDQPITGNGYTYTPNVTPVYDLGPDNFLPNQGTLGMASTSAKQYLAFQRKDPATVFNKVQIEYLSRAYLYNPTTISRTDDANIAATKRLRLSDLRSHHFFALDSAAQMSVALQLAREQHIVNLYQATVGRKYALLDVMDPVTLTEPALQLFRQLVRIIEIQENLDSTLTMTFEEVPLTASAPLYGGQVPLGGARNNNAPPGNVNPPIFFEPPDQYSKGLVLLIGLSGINPAIWGGCDVWFSTDGANYGLIGQVQGATRMGALTAPLPSIAASSTGTTIDATNTLAVSLAESNGALASGVPSDMTALATACVVDGEIVAYQNATLTGPNAYNLSPLLRGGYGSAIAAHNAGAPFMRLDGTAFADDFPSSLVGTQGYFKFTSFNIFGAATQNLSDVGAYPYTFTGAALSSPLPPVTNLYTNFANGFQQIFWDEIADFRSGIFYEIRQGATWATALVLKTQAHPPFIAQGQGTFWVSAKCTPITGLTVYSSAPAEIVISGNQLSLNLITSWDEQATGWPGKFDNGLGTTGIGANLFARIGGAGNILAQSAGNPPPVLESLATSASAAAGTNVLTFASVPASIVAGMAAADTTAGAAIPAGITVVSTTPTTITLSDKIAAPGVGNGDTIVFSIADVLDFGGIITSTPLYYTAPLSHAIDVGYVAKASINATMLPVGVPLGQNILTVGDFLNDPDVLGAAATQFVDGWVEIRIAQGTTTDVFAPDDVFALADAFAPSFAWGPWQKFIPGVFLGRAFQLRMALETFSPQVVAYALSFNYQVQVPARIDHYQGLSVPNTGLAITFQPDGAASPAPFNAGPAANALPLVSVSYTPASTGEYFQITGLSLSGLTITFFNSSNVAIAQSGVSVTVEGY